MSIQTVPTNSRLNVTYSLHEAESPVSSRWVVLHHGICHTREQFRRLIEQLNQRGLHVAMVDQQSEHAGFFRNALGTRHYREGMAAALRKIEADTGRKIGSYAFHSMGAFIGEETQQRYAELRRPTVLMAPIPVNGALPVSLRILWRHPLAFLKAVFTLSVHSLVDTPEEVRELFFDPFTPEPIVQETTKQLKHAPFWIYLQLILRRVIRPSIRDDGLPKLLLYSDTDEIFHPREYNQLEARFAQLTRQHILGGHDFFIQYAEQAAESIHDFHQTHNVEAILGSPAGISGPHFAKRPAAVDAAEQVEGE